MTDIPNDSQGTPLAAGQRVAFNRSGYVIPGTIIGIAPSVRVTAWRVRDSVCIKADDGSVSHVRNSKAILVI